MPQVFGRLAAVLTAASSLFVADAALAGARPLHMILAESAPAPVGFLQFCGRYPQACKAAAPESMEARAQLRGYLSPVGFSLRDFDRNLRDAGADDVAMHTSAIAPDAEPEAADAVTEADEVAPQRASELFPRPIILPPIAALEIPALEAAIERISLTAETRALLTRVNRKVNRIVRPRSDLAMTGRAEFWSLPIALNGRLFGDCEDFALQKKAELIEAGLPASALTLAVVNTRRGEVHAVLVVETDQGDLVLDNRSSWVLPWAEVNYHWVARQVRGDSMRWARVTAAGA